MKPKIKPGFFLHDDIGTNLHAHYIDIKEAIHDADGRRYFVSISKEVIKPNSFNGMPSIHFERVYNNKDKVYLEK